MKRWALFIPFGIFVLLGFMLYRGLFLDPRDIPSALVDKNFPEFNLPTLVSNQAKTVADIKGQAHLVNIWGTWCISCRVEHPFLVELANKGVSIIGINYKDDNTAALKWLDDLGNPYLFSVDDEAGTLSMDLGVTGAPETFFVDASGVIRHKHLGPITADNWPKLEKKWLAIKEDGMNQKANLNAPAGS